jgi:hypothetical protein
LQESIFAFSPGLQLSSPGTPVNPVKFASVFFSCHIPLQILRVNNSSSCIQAFSFALMMGVGGVAGEEVVSDTQSLVGSVSDYSSDISTLSN